MVTKRTIRERVQRGVKLLDSYDKNWFKKVDLSTFEITEPCSCILGQVFKKKACTKQFFAKNTYAGEDDKYLFGLFNLEKILGFPLNPELHGFDLLYRPDTHINANWDNHLDMQQYLNDYWLIVLERKLHASKQHINGSKKPPTRKNQAVGK